MRISTPVTILSAESDKLSSSRNEWRTMRLRKQLTDYKFSFMEVEGKYDGKSEVAFCVVTHGGTSGQVWPTLVGLAYQWGQESVLHIDANGYATVFYISREGQPARVLGMWRKVGRECAENKEAYTKVGCDYYVAG